MSLINRAFGNSLTLGKSLFSVVQGTWAQQNAAGQTDFDDQMVSQAGLYAQWTGAANSDEIKIPNMVFNAGTYEIKIVTYKDTGNAILECLHGASSLGTFDSYAAATAYNQIVTFVYSPTVRTIADFRIRVNGRNGASADWGIGVSRIQIRKIGEAMTLTDALSFNQGKIQDSGGNEFSIIANTGKHIGIKGVDGGFFVIGFDTPGTTYITVSKSHLLCLLQAATVSEPAFINGGRYFNSTLNKDMIGGATVFEVQQSMPKTPSVIAAGATPTLDASLNSVYTLAPVQNETIGASNVPTYGKRVTIVITSDNGSRVLTFGANFKSTGTLNCGAVAGKVFTIDFVSDGTNLNEVARTTAM